MENNNASSFFYKDKQKKMASIFILVAIIIILLLIFLVFFYRRQIIQSPTGNIDVFEIKCNDNCSCSGNSSNVANDLNSDSSITNILISKGNLNFNKNIVNYTILVENEIDKITINAIKNNDKTTIYYIYNKKIYNQFNDIPILVGENIVTVISIAENGSLTSYKVSISRLDKNGEIVNEIPKDANTNLSNLTISHGDLIFEASKKSYIVYVEDSLKKITINATSESKKASISYVYNGKIYHEFNDIKITSPSSVVTIVVTAENGNSTNYVINIKKTTDLPPIDGLQWYSTNNLNIFSNPAYNGEAIISPGSSNSYEFTIKNKVEKNIEYQINFKEKTKFPINMKYRLKRNGKYIVGNDDEWVSYNKLNISQLTIDKNKADNYILDWKWFDGDNDTLIGKLQDEYTLSITLSAVVED